MSYKKMKKKLAAKALVAKEVLAGNYTRKRIPLSWEGKPIRTDLIKDIVKQMGYTSYLEIGCRKNACFSRIEVPHKVGVDPDLGGTHRMTSDEFFAQNKEIFDIIFIDGLHLYEQVILDIKNSLTCLNDGGTIIMHDCLPTQCLAQYTAPVINAWNGDTWKAFVEVRTWPDIDAATCTIDRGVGVIKKRKNSNPIDLKQRNFKKLKYLFLVNNYRSLMNTQEYDAALEFARNN